VLADRPPFEDLYREFLGRIYAYVRAQVGASADRKGVELPLGLGARHAAAAA